jgi:heme/copper-type cytochrome/quinol oxidase subunit 4
VLLLLRKKLATIVFLVALIAIVVQMTYGLILARSYEVTSTFQTAMAIIVPVVGLLLYLFSRNSAEKGWIN